MTREEMHLIEGLLRVATEHPKTRKDLLPLLARYAAETSPTEEGAKKLFERYRREHPKTKKTPRDFFDPKKNKGESKEDKAPSAPPKSKSLFSPREMNLPAVASQKVKTEKELFAQAKEAHEQQLDWLNRGKGIDKALGAEVIRGDKPGAKTLDYDKPGPVVLIGPMKKAERSREKVNAEYGGDWSKLSDVVRASIAVDSFDQVEETLDKLRKSGMKLARQPKDRFAQPTEAGYRDIQLIVEYPNGHVGELQIHMKPILKAKDEGHKYYEQVRSISAKAKEEGRNTLTDEEQKIVDEANNKMKALYGEAWARSGQKRGKGKKASQKIAAKRLYYEYDGVPCYWEYKKFPQRIMPSGKEDTIYELENFFMDATPLKKPEYDKLVSEWTKKGKK